MINNSLLAADLGAIKKRIVKTAAKNKRIAISAEKVAMLMLALGVVCMVIISPIEQALHLSPVNEASFLGDTDESVSMSDALLVSESDVVSASSLATSSSSTTALPINLYGKVTASKLNVRKNASTSGKVLTTVASGKYIQLTSAIVNSNGAPKWYKTTVNGVTGFVSASYVSVSVKTTSAVNLRKNATTGSSVITCLKTGVTLKVSAYKKTSGKLWYKTTYNSSTGYVCGSYTTYVNSSTGANSTTSVTTSSTTTKVVTVSKNNVNLRSSASSSSKVVTTLSNGTVLNIKSAAGTASKWWKVSCTQNGKTYTGYVYKGCTTEKWSLSSSDLNKLYKIVMGEAGSESVRGQKMIAQAVLDRAAYYNSFSKACSGLATKSSVTSQVKNSVNAVVNGERVTTTRVLWWYNPKATKSSWHESKTYVTTIGNHKFFTAF